MAMYRKLGRTSSQRKALLRNQITALLYRGRIITTEAKAKEIRSGAEALITLAKKERDNFETVTVTAKVAVDMCEKLFNDIAPKYAERNGGYTRIVKVGPRKGDGAMMVVIELV